MNSLKIDSIHQGAWTLVEMGGSLIEGSDVVLSPLISSSGANFIFDFTKIQSVNSSGIAEWIEFRGKFDKNRIIILQGCSPAVVTVMNLMKSFIGKAQIRSVWVPMVCVNCGVGKSLRLEINPGFSLQQSTLNQATCSDCGKPIEAQVDLEDYLAFVL